MSRRFFCPFLQLFSAAAPNLHDAERLGLLHLAEDGSEDLVQLLAELRPRPGDQSGHEAAHEGGGELGGARVQQLVDHLHDVPEAAVALLVPPLADLLQGHRHVGTQTLASVLGWEKKGGQMKSVKALGIQSAVSGLEDCYSCRAKSEAVLFFFLHSFSNTKKNFEVDQV